MNFNFAKTDYFKAIKQKNNLEKEYKFIKK